MGIFDKFADSPGQIRTEGQEITISFARVGDGTGVITWNIPRPSAGCNSTNQAYDGIVITISNVPANYTTTSPQDGSYYNADPTADPDAHMADVLDGARVIGAFYHDRTTVSMVVQDVADRTPYYVSGYAVDAQGRYHREGVHAYSIPSGVGDKLSDDLSAYQDVGIVAQLPLSINAPTGLEVDKDYGIVIQRCCTEYGFKVKGRNSLTFKDLIRELNAAFAEAMCPDRGPVAPNTGKYFVDVNKHTLQRWCGSRYADESVIFSDNDPSIPEFGKYWYDLNDDRMYQYESSGWVERTNIIRSPFDVTIEGCGAMWFDGTNAWEWDGNMWAKKCVIIGERNPLLPPILGCDTYWYNPVTGFLNVWDADVKAWKSVDVLYWHQSPNALDDGTLWLDESVNLVKILRDGKFVVDERIIVREPTKAGTLPRTFTVEPGTKWYIPSTQTLQVFVGNDTWSEHDIDIRSPIDPTQLDGDTLWWNKYNDELSKWDVLNAQWVPVTTFYQSAEDPRIPPTLQDCAVWFNTKTQKLTDILSASCNEVTTILTAHDPYNLPNGYLWFDGSVWYVRDGGAWLVIDPVISLEDPTLLPDGIFWFNTGLHELNHRVTGEWIQVPFSEDSLVPEIGQQWFDTADDILLEWDGVTWIPSMPFIFVEWVPRTCKEKYDVLRFKTKKRGCTDCDIEFKILTDKGNLLQSILPSVMYYEPVGGHTGLVDGPTYQMLGIGDDGDPAERRELADTIRIALGYPSVAVELTKEQLDRAIDNALMVIRKRSSFGYLRGLFFLDILPNQQVYELTNECVGYNKIVDVMTIYRNRGAGLRGAYAGGDHFTTAALQQMYHVGTFDILTFHLTASYMEELATLFAERFMFQWTERTRTLRIHNYTRRKERVLIDCMIERTEQDLLTSRDTAYFIQRWAIMEAKQMLGAIRGKFQSLPGPNGSTQLNGMELSQQATDERALLEEELQDMGMQDAVNVGLGSHFILG